MARKVVAFCSGSALMLLAAASAFGQGKSAPMLVSRQASAGSGAISGIVRDADGGAVSGASIVALGAAPLPAMARTDGAGRFAMTLPAGEYILRATREGYLSTYREPVRVQSSSTLERNITLVRQGAAVVMLAGATGAIQEGARRLPSLGAEDPLSSDYPQDETAWRLRHLPPTALRDVSGANSVDTTLSNDFRPHLSVLDWVMGESTHAATSFFTNTNFTGQVNLLTSGSLAASAPMLPSLIPRGIAYASVSAPVADSGDWTVRAAMAPGGPSSWVLLGEYEAHPDRTHALKVGLSYSSQLSASGDVSAIAAVNDQSRSAGGVSFTDRWHAGPALELDYGMRLDHYDYVDGNDFLSPSIGARVAVLPQTTFTMRASERAIAPGADEFLPPPSAGPWLPPERTFSPLVAGAPFLAERVRDYEVGVEQQVGRGGFAPTLGVRRLSEHTADQIATLFGLDDKSGDGHYYAADPGSVDLNVWVLHASGQMLRHVRGSVEYALGDADWRSSRDATAIAMVSSSVARRGRESLRDLTTTIEANSPDGATTVLLSYRANNVFSQPAGPTGAPAFDGRFALELHQALPVHPTRDSKLELLFSVRNLFRDLREPASIYDELLTVAPPLRIMGGVQVKF